MISVFIDYDGVLKLGADGSRAGPMIAPDLLARVRTLPARLQWLTMRGARTRARALPGVPAAAMVESYPQSTWFATDHSWWKLQTVRTAVAPGERFVWIDDRIAPAARSWAAGRDALLISPDPSIGLTRDHLDDIERFTRHDPPGKGGPCPTRWTKC